MNDEAALELSRDCSAVQIPAGNTVTLPAGTAVEITQRLGGGFTVRALGALFSIAAVDADALGFAREQTGPDVPGSPAAGPVTVQQVWEVLRGCYDPEIPVNIVDLGLVYEVAVESLADGDARVEVKMTLTAPGCGMGPMIARDARDKILAVSGVRDARVDLVWDPPWHPSMITPEGRRALDLD